MKRLIARIAARLLVALMVVAAVVPATAQQEVDEWDLSRGRWFTFHASPGALVGAWVNIGNGQRAIVQKEITQPIVVQRIEMWLGIANYAVEEAAMTVVLRARPGGRPLVVGMHDIHKHGADSAYEAVSTVDIRPAPGGGWLLPAGAVVEIHAQRTFGAPVAYQVRLYGVGSAITGDPPLSLDEPSMIILPPQAVRERFIVGR